MKKKNFTGLISVLALMFFSISLNAEFLYLKDGQVLQGKIIAEDSSSYTIQTKFQTKKVARDDVTRIMYGERKMERIYLLMNDGSKMNGFLVDQDATQIILRDREDSPNERTIPKSTIKQMSGSEIVPLEPSIFIRTGIFYPLNSGGSKLSPAPIFFAGSDFNFQWVDNLRVHGEAGYSKCTSSHEGLYMQFIPILVSANYDIAYSRLHFVPKIYLGATVIDFDDGELENTREVSFSPGAGCGVTYEFIERHFYMGFWADYFFMKDKSSNLHCVAATLSASYRF